MIKIIGLGVVGLSSTTGIYLAQVPVLPEGFATWPVQAMMFFLAITSMSITLFVVAKSFKAIENLKGVADNVQELCARLNERPCLRNEK